MTGKRSGLAHASAAPRDGNAVAFSDEACAPAPDAARIPLRVKNAAERDLALWL
jgi:hypothetical protein